MHGMLSAAILILVIVLVAVVGGGSMAWLYRAASPSSGYPRSPAPETAVAAPAPRPEIENPEGHVLALPAAAEPREPVVPPATEPPDPARSPAESGPATEPPEDGGPSAGARIYVLDSSRRSSR